MFLKVYKFKLLLALLLVPFLVSADPPGWDKTETLFTNVINIPSTVVPTLDGVAIEDGDWVGVFFNDEGTLVCGGSVEYAGGANIGFSAFGDDFTSPEKDGFADGESFVWAIYDASADVTVYGEATYAAKGVGVFTFPFFTHTLASLTAPSGFAVTATATPDLFCGMGGDATLSGAAVAGGPITSWEWYDNGNMVGTGNDLVVSVMETTNFRLVASDGVATAEAFVTVTVNTVYAGPDEAICAAGDYTLAGAMVSDFLTLDWETSGTGTFADAGVVNAVYTPSADDVTAGSVTLTLNVVSQDCGAMSDEVMLTFQAEPSIEILPDQDYACYGDPFPFAGLVDADNYDALQWFTTNGGGFFDDETILEPTYFPSSTIDWPQLCIIIGVTASAIDPCIVAADDYMNLCFVAPPTAFAGDPMTECSDVATTYTFADAAVTFDPNWGGEILWTFAGGDGSLDDATIQNPTYTYGPNDLLLGGQIDFTLTATTPEACDPAVSMTSLTIQLAPSIEIIPDSYTICEGECMDFEGLVVASDYSELQWYTTNGGGFFDDEKVLEPVYCPSPTIDYPQVCVELWVTASPIDPCSAFDEDMMLLCFQMLPTVVAGDDATICANETYTTNPTVENSAGPYMWTHDGNGHFDDPTLFNATYFPDISDTYNTVTLTLTADPIAPCGTPGEGSMELYIECAPYVDAGPDQTICETDNATLECVAECVEFVMWATTGDGYFLCPDCIQGGTTYFPGPGDLAAGCVTLVLVGYPLDPCTMWEVDKMVLCFSPAPFVDAGPDQTICEDGVANVNGIANDVDNHIWVTYNGSGSFDDDMALSTFYTPGPTDVVQPVGLILIGAPILPCTVADSDTLMLTVQQRPQVFAGDANIICEDGSYTLADATAEFASSVMWTTGGDGSFDDPFLLNATYTPGPGDNAAGFAELCLTGYTIAPCVGSESSCMILTLQCLPEIEIIPDAATICYGDSFDFEGLVVGACYASLQWFTTNGGGIYDDETIIDPVYFPSPTIDYPQGCIILGVAAAPIDPCSVASEDFMDLCFQPPVEVNAGDDATICEDDTYAMMPVIVNGGDVFWSTLGDGSFDDPTNPNAVYTHGPMDRAAGYVELCIEVQGLSTCPAESDCMMLYITWKPEAYAGEDQTVCEHLCLPPNPWANGQAFLTDATVAYNCGQMWSTLGDGTFDDPMAVNTFYTLGDGDIANGSVELCLTAEACDPCTVADVDCVTITVQPYATADAGPDVTICEGEGAQLDGTAVNASGVFWDYAFLGEGDGMFSSQVIEDPMYYPGAQDILDGQVELIFVVFPIDPCTYPDADVMTVYITRQPVADAGDDATVCAGETHQLNGFVEFATGGFEWIGGDGTFTPDAMTLDAVYTPGPLDIAAGAVDICLWAYDASVCVADYFDCMTLTILPPPEVAAGDDQTICEGDDVQLAGWSNNTSSTLWETAGDGSFDDASLLDAVYTPGMNDIAAGSVVLTITGYPLDPCTATVSDDMTVTINPQPAIGFCFDGVLAGTGSMFEYCFDETVNVSLCEVWAGTGPFDICYTVNNGPEVCVMDVNLGDVFASDILPVGINVIQITSITDDNGCMALDVTPYMAEVIVHPEPDANFCVNGVVSGYGDMFEFCYDETVVVDMCEILVGTGPFTVCWTVDNGPEECATVDEGGELFNGLLPVGDHVIQLTSITDANGCMLADPSLYTMTITILPEPVLGFCFNGVEATSGAMFEYCYDEPVVIDLCNVYAGTGPFEVCYDITFNGSPLVTGECQTVNLGDQLWNDLVDVGVYVVTVTSIVDDKGCVVADPGAYTATVTIYPEPDANFCVNGEVSGYGDMFEFCYDETVVVDMCEILSGTGPFTVCWTMDGGPEECATVDEGGELFNGILPVGVHVIQLTSLTDAHGCVLADPSLYTMTITINPEPTLEVTLDGAAPMAMNEYCFDDTFEICLAGVTGTPDWTVEWAVTGPSGPFGDVMTGVSECWTFNAIDYLPGVYDLFIISLTDAKGCVATQATLDSYAFQIQINEEPFVGFCFDGVLAGTGDVFEYCYDEAVTATLCEIWGGTAPFTINYNINGVPQTEVVANLGDVLFSGILAPDTYLVEVTSIVDANGCASSDVTPYTATVVVHPEPFITFAVNGNQVAPGYFEEFCYDETISVTLFDIWTGDAPFEVCYSVLKDGLPFLDDCVTLTNPGDVLNSGIFDPGTYELSVTSLTDANGCVASQATLDLYTGTIVVNPEPDANFCVNGVVSGYGDMFEFCYDETVVVDMCEILSGTGPFTVCWTLDGGAEECATVDEGGELFNGLLPVGDHVIQLTSLTDAKGCVLADPTPYTMTITILPEPIAAFCFNDELAATGSIFEYCYDETVEATLCDIVAGTGPFDVCWTVNGGPEECATVDVGGVLFSGVMLPGTYVVQVTSIVDAKGCVASTTAPYTATVVVHPEPSLGFCFNGVEVTSGQILDYCVTETVVIDLCNVYAGTGPFEVCYDITLDGSPLVTGECQTVSLGDQLWNDLVGPGQYVVTVTSITDAAGCVVADPGLYTVTVNMQPEPTVDAGDDLTTCEETPIMLTGDAMYYSSVMWSGGLGGFNPADALVTEYTPAAGEFGAVTITLTAQPISPCLVAYSDDMVLFVQEGPDANAGGDQTICDNEPFATLNGVCLNGSGVEWTTPDGTGFFDDGFTCTDLYYPSMDDISAGSVTLCLTVYPIDPCQVSDQDCITLTFAPSPTADAGDDATICEGDEFPVSGTATNYSSVLWTTDGDGTFDTPDALDAIYTHGPNDASNGFVTLTFTAEPTGGCLVPDSDDLILTIVAKPTVDLGDDKSLSCDDYDFANSEWMPVELFPVIANYTTVQWTSSGTGYFDDPTAVNAVYHLSSDDIWGGEIELCIAVNGEGACSFVATDCVTIYVPQQIILFDQNGWWGVSSYLDTDLPTVPEVMAPIVEDPIDLTGSRHLVIQINKSGQYYWPEPTPAINQLGDWAPIGYKAKIKYEPACLPIFGDTLVENTFEISGAFTYVPVLTNVKVNILDLFGPDTANILLIYDWVTTDAWFPDVLDQLTEFVPGKAYLLVNRNPFGAPYTVDFPDYDPNVTFVTDVAGGNDAGNNSPWNDVENTALPHFIMFADQALAQLQPGDIIGAFNQYEECVGMAEFSDRSSFYKLVAMGDDPITQAIDGFETDEYMNFKLYRQATAETFEVTFTYDTQYPNYNGLFAINGVSKVVNMTMSITGINDIPANYSVSVYPNPANSVVNIASDYNMTSVTLVNYVGQTVYTEAVTGNSHQINVSNYVTGMYFVRIETTDGSVITKRLTID